ncbi:general substrate transporter [Phycomyces blakesleeanus]|uniref:General substrate transporter n=1 Tax=Phycomyces blakesleeanus TaxID=4837 RepID=A0ABR3BG74_PHYBL
MCSPSSKNALITSGLLKPSRYNSIQAPPQPQFRKSVYLSALVAAFGGFVCGFDTGAISGIMAIPVFKTYFFTPTNMVYFQGFILALFLMTAAIGSLLSGFCCDVTILLIGRAIGGFGAGLMSNAIALYHSEIAPPDIRGRLISFFTLMSLLGQVAGYFFTFYTSHWTSNWSWRAPWMFQITVCASCAILLNVLPFSPRWLIDHGYSEDALLVLAELHSTDVDDIAVQKEYEGIKSEIEFEQSLGHRTYSELFHGSNRKRTFISFFITISTSFTGSVAIWYYAPQIFMDAGMTDVSSSIAATGGTGILSFFATAVSLRWFVDDWGRKPIFLSGSVLMGVSMFVIGTMFSQYTVLDTNTGKVIVTNTCARGTIIAFIYIFTATFSSTYGIATFVYPAEIFNMRTRAKGLALSYSLNWVFSILIAYSVPLFITYTVSGLYFFFGTCCIICFIGCCFIPETKGRTLEEMEILFRSVPS